MPIDDSPAYDRKGSISAGYFLVRIDCINFRFGYSADRYANSDKSDVTVRFKHIPAVHGTHEILHSMSARSSKPPLAMFRFGDREYESDGPDRAHS